MPHQHGFFLLLKTSCTPLKIRIEDDEEKSVSQADSSWFIFLSAFKEQRWLKVILRLEAIEHQRSSSWIQFWGLSIIVTPQLASRVEAKTVVNTKAIWTRWEDKRLSEQLTFLTRLEDLLPLSSWKSSRVDHNPCLKQSGTCMYSAIWVEDAWRQEEEKNALSDLRSIFLLNMMIYWSLLGTWLKAWHMVAVLPGSCSRLSDQLLINRNCQWPHRVQHFIHLPSQVVSKEVNIHYRCCNRTLSQRPEPCSWLSGSHKRIFRSPEWTKH